MRNVDVPTLRILIPRPLDSDMSVCNEKFDMTAPRLEIVVYGVVLIFAYIIRDMQPFALGAFEALD